MDLGLYKRLEEDKTKYYQTKEFVQKHVDSNSLKSYGKNGELKFKPKEITVFLRKYFPRTYEPKALFIVLDIECKKENLVKHKLISMNVKQRTKTLMEMALYIYENNKNDNFNSIITKIKNHPSVSDDSITESNWSTYLKPITKIELDHIIAQKRAKMR